MHIQLKPFELTMDVVMGYKLKWEGYRIINDFGCFYKIENIRDGKGYVGRTKSFYYRMKTHVFSGYKVNALLIDKMMNDNIMDWNVSVLAKYEDIDACFDKGSPDPGKIEQALIKRYNTKHPNGYNLSVYERI